MRSWKILNIEHGMEEFPFPFLFDVLTKCLFLQFVWNLGKVGIFLWSWNWSGFSTWNLKAVFLSFVLAPGYCHCSLRFLSFCQPTVIATHLSTAIVTQLGMVMDINLDYDVAVRAKDSLRTLVWISDVMFITMSTSLSVITGPKRIRQIVLTLRILEEVSYLPFLGIYHF